MRESCCGGHCKHQGCGFRAGRLRLDRELAFYSYFIGSAPHALEAGTCLHSSALCSRLLLYAANALIVDINGGRRHCKTLHGDRAVGLRPSDCGEYHRT